MPFGTFLSTIFFGQKVGQDEFGNRYYLDRRTKGQKRERRWVIYKGISDASKVPPLWHGWLHRSLKDPPTTDNSRLYPWQKQHQPNLTGTSLAYLPPGHPAKGQKRRHMEDYEAWSPENS